jgi:hypothetical protein
MSQGEVASSLITLLSRAHNPVWFQNKIKSEFNQLTEAPGSYITF